MKPTFSGGPNIAMKVPSQHFEATVVFYRETLGLAEIDELKPDVVFQFGANRLWIDPTPRLEQAELWLQIQTDNLEGAADHLEQLRTDRAERIEALPEGFSGFWISSPTGVVHLASQGSQT